MANTRSRKRAVEGPGSSTDSKSNKRARKTRGARKPEPDTTEDVEVTYKTIQSPLKGQTRAVSCLTDSSNFISGSVEQQTPKKQRNRPGFFDLPRELRDQIYSAAWGHLDYLIGEIEDRKYILRLVLHENVPSLLSAPSTCSVAAAGTSEQGCEHAWGLPTWLKTNKQMLREAFEVLGRERTLIPVACVLSNPWSCHALRSPAPNVLLLENIRSVQVAAAIRPYVTRWPQKTSTGHNSISNDSSAGHYLFKRLPKARGKRLPKARVGVWLEWNVYDKPWLKYNMYDEPDFESEWRPLLAREHEAKKFSWAGSCSEVVIELTTNLNKVNMDRCRELFPAAVEEAKRCARRLLGRKEDSKDEGLAVVVGEVDDDWTHQLVKLCKLGEAGKDRFHGAPFWGTRCREITRHRQA
jgi:hypothetical protein